MEQIDNKQSINSLVILTQYYPPEPGAPQIRLETLAKELIKIGIDVQIITAFPNYPEGKIFEAYRGKFMLNEIRNGIKIKRAWIYPASGRNTIKRLINYFSFSFTSLWILLFSKRVDLVFVEAQPITLGITAYINKIIKQVPYIYNTPDLQIEHAEEAGWIKSKLFIALAKKLESRLMHKSLSVSTVTNAFIKFFSKERNIPIQKFSFLPNGANTKELYPSPFNIDFDIVL